MRGLRRGRIGGGGRGNGLRVDGFAGLKVRFGGRFGAGGGDGRGGGEGEGVGGGGDGEGEGIGEGVRARLGFLVRRGAALVRFTDACRGDGRRRGWREGWLDEGFDGVRDTEVRLGGGEG